MHIRQRHIISTSCTTARIAEGGPVSEFARPVARASFDRQGRHSRRAVYSPPFQTVGVIAGAWLLSS